VIENINCIILGIGYCEDAQVSQMVYTTNFNGGPYKDISPQYGVELLATDLYHKYISELYSSVKMNTKYNKCCKYIVENVDVDQCPACGSAVNVRPEFDGFINYIRDLSKCTADAYGDSESALVLNDDGEEVYCKLIWSPYWSDSMVQHIQNNEFLIVPESGEVLLAYAMLSKDNKALHGVDYQHSEPDKSYKNDFLERINNLIQHTENNIIK
jgi:RNA polymerase subunit RPABC4/transcription elongation factor Spt4